MSTPPLSRPNGTGAGPLTESDLARFRAWLAAQGYAVSTARLWAARVRDAHAHGVEDPAAVDAAYVHLRQTTRAGLRAALLMFGEFREAGA